VRSFQIRCDGSDKVGFWSGSLCDVCEQLVCVDAPSAEHQENRSDVVWVCNKLLSVDKDILLGSDIVSVISEF